MTSEDFDDFAATLAALRRARERGKDATKASGAVRRRALSASQRRDVLAKTGGRCHICGGAIDSGWQADHVLAHSGGGAHATDNYLPAHDLCNNYRWDYLAEEFQTILKLGVWARNQIEKRSTIGRAIAEKYLRYEHARMKRRRSGVDDQPA